MNLPDTHEKVVKTLATCKTEEQVVVAKRFVALWQHWLIHMWSNATDPTSRNTFIAYYERLRYEVDEILNP